MRLAAVNGNDIVKRTADFSRRIVRLCSALSKMATGHRFTSQLFRCGTSIGAQIAEANFAKSRADFISKLDGALQEAEETRYWLELIRDSGVIKAGRLEPLLQETGEIIAILVTMVGKSREIPKT